MVICEENYNIGILYFILDVIWKILGLFGLGIVYKVCVCCLFIFESFVYEIKYIVYRYDNVKIFIYLLYVNCFCVRLILFLYFYFWRVLYCIFVSFRNWVVVFVFVLVVVYLNFYYN